ncbi:MAG: hypothetical protein IPP37_09365 [Saprospiraceae bacterium]|nr:hypothetical protein [Saprospiraceae bacterium]
MQTNIVNINDEIEVFLSQKPSSNTIAPVLEISTVDSISCANTELWVESNLGSQNIEIDILGLVLDGNCVIGNVKPMTEVVLNPAIGNYNLTFDLKNSIKSKGKIEITNDLICLSMSEETGVVAGHQCIQRLHPHAVWGYFQCASESDMLQFNASLAALPYVGFPGNAGNYGIFSMSENRQVTLSNFQFDLQRLPKLRQLYFQIADFDRFLIDLDQILKNFNEFKLELYFYNGTTLKR